MADGEELLGVDGVFGEYLLHGARMHMDTLGKPLVGVVLPPKFLPDCLSDVYLHKKEPRGFFVGTRGSGLPITYTKKLAICYASVLLLVR